MMDEVSEQAAVIRFMERLGFKRTIWNNKTGVVENWNKGTVANGDFMAVTSVEATFFYRAFKAREAQIFSEVREILGATNLNNESSDRFNACLEISEKIDKLENSKAVNGLTTLKQESKSALRKLVSELVDEVIGSSFPLNIDDPVYEQRQRAKEQINLMFGE